MSDDPRPYEINPFEEVADVVSEMRADPQISNLFRHIQRAQVLHAERNPYDEHARDEFGIPWLTGSGNCSSPADDPPWDLEQDADEYDSFSEVPAAERDLQYPRGSVVRIALWANHDHRYDRLLVGSGHVYAAAIDRIDAQSIAEILDTTTGLPGDLDALTSLEGEMLEQLAIKLLGDPNDPGTPGVIAEVADAMDQDEVPIHIVIFDRHTHECLVNATARHRDRKPVDALHDLLAFRSGIETGAYDEPMLTILSDEIEQHVALPHPNTGLIGAWDQLVDATFPQFTTSDSCSWASPHLLAPPWTAQSDKVETPTQAWQRHTDDSIVSLLHTFDWQFFDRSSVPMGHHNDGLLPKYTPGENPSGDVYVPTRVDFGSQLPLAYTWHALGELEPKSAREQRIQDRFDGAQEFAQYAYQHPPSGRHEDGLAKSAVGRLDHEDILLVAKRLAHGNATMERLLRYRSTDVSHAKIARGPHEWATVDLGGANLTRGAREVIEQENYAAEADALTHLGKPIPDRIASGESAAIQIDGSDADTGGATSGIIVHNNKAASITASLTPTVGTELGVNAADTEYNWVDDPDIINERLTLDNWVVLQPLDDNGEPTLQWGNKPDKLMHGVLATVNDIDRSAGRVELTVMNTFGGQDIPEQFDPWHLNWYTAAGDGTPPTDDERFYVELAEGSRYMVDPSVASVPAGRAYSLLNSAHPPELMNLFENIATSGSVPTGTGFDAANVEAVIDALDQTAGTTPMNNPPLNQKQQEVGKRTARRVVWVQGPFGSGKSSAALSAKVVANAVDRAVRSEPACIIVAVPSNRSGDEIAVDIGGRSEQARRSSEIKGADDLLVARVASGTPTLDASEFDEVAYCGSGYADQDTYYGTHFDLDSPIAEVRQRLAARATPTPGSADAPAPDDGGPLVVVATPSKLWKLLKSVFDDETPQSLAAQGTRFFDALAVDEASQFAFAKAGVPGAFLTETSQVVVGGDHRQLRMVHQHEWDEETRRTVKSVGAHLSLMDFVRVCDGESVASVDRDNLQYGFDADIPYTGLNVCYRCNDTITKFCRPVYREDGITLETHPNNSNNRAAPPNARTPEMEQALDPEWPLVAFTHDDQTGGAQNETEANIAAEAVAGFDLGVDKVGIVVAHNDQETLIKERLAAHPEIDDPSQVKVDTADGFQGGERDIVLVSLSASDPAYIDSEEDFILLDNRSLVALTRARAKVVVLASEALLRTVPEDPELYKRTMLLRNLATATDVADRLELNHQGRAGTPLESNRSLVPNVDDIAVEKVRRHDIMDLVPTGVDPGEDINLYRFQAIDQS